MKENKKVMAQLRKDRTAFVIAHRLSTIRKADLIVVMEGGEVRERGTQEELLVRSGGVYRRLYELQFSVGGAAEPVTSS